MRFDITPKAVLRRCYIRTTPHTALDSSYQEAWHPSLSQGGLAVPWVCTGRVSPGATASQIDRLENPTVQGLRSTSCLSCKASKHTEQAGRKLHDPTQTCSPALKKKSSRGPCHQVSRVFSLQTCLWPQALRSISAGFVWSPSHFEAGVTVCGGTSV